MIDETQLRQEVRKIVLDLLRAAEDDPQLTDDESLIVNRRLTSMQLVEMVAIFEQRYKLDVAKIGFDQYDYDSVDSIVKLLRNNIS